MSFTLKSDNKADTGEEAAALASLSIAAELIEGSAYALARTRPGNELTYLFLLAANLEKEVNRISKAVRKSLPIQTHFGEPSGKN